MKLDQTMQALDEFIRADNWQKSKEVVETHESLLLSDLTEQILAKLITAAEADENEQAVRIFNQHRLVLQRCQEKGIEATFASLAANIPPPSQPADTASQKEAVLQALEALIEADSPPALLQVAQDHPVLFTPTAELFIRQGINRTQKTEQVELAHLLKRRFELLQQLKKTAHENGLTLEQAINLAQQPDPTGFKELLDTLQHFLQTETWAEAKNLVEQNPALLSDNAQILLDRLISAAEEQHNEAGVKRFSQHRTVLQECRDQGIETAFAALINNPPKIPTREHSPPQDGAAESPETSPDIASEENSSSQEDNVEVPMVINEAIEAMLKADSMLALLKVGRDYPVLFTEATAMMIQEGNRRARSAGQTELASVLEARYDVLQKIQHTAQEQNLSLDEAIVAAEQAEDLWEKAPETAQRLTLTELIKQFLQTESWQKTKILIEQYPELLTKETDVLLEQLIESAEADNHDQFVRILSQHRALLQQCRQVGIEAAFAGLPE